MNESKEFREIIAHVREQVLYLQELGVDTFDAKLSDRQVVNEVLKMDTQEPSRSAASIPEITILTPKPIEQRPAVSRLAELPSLSKRATPPAPAPAPPQSNGADLFGDIAPALPEPTETIEQIR